MTSTSEQKNDQAKKGGYLEVKKTGVARGTNILDVPVDPRLRVNFRTGIDWFDLAQGGKYNPGCRPGMVMLLTAVPGGGKTTLALQLADSITRRKHIALYNTREQSLEDIKMSCERIGVERGFICDEKYMLEDLLAHAMFLMMKNPDKQLVLVIDSLKTMDDGFYNNGATNSMTPVRVIQRLIEFCKATYAIAIVIGHVNKKGEFEGKQQLKHDLDAHAHIHFDQNKKSETYGKRIYRYSKNRCGPITMSGTILDMTDQGAIKLDGTLDLDEVPSDD